MKQFLLRDRPLPDGRIILSGEDYHYLVRVRRVKSGDVINAALPDGVPVRLTVISAGKDRLICDAGEMSAEKPWGDGDRSGDRRPMIILLQAIPQPTKMDLLVRQSTEGGVYAIVPFVSRYSDVSPYSAKAARATSRLERWRRIVREARQQSGSPVATTVADIRDSLDEVLVYYRETRTENTAALVLHEKETAGSGAFHRTLASRPDRVFIAVGPEGGLSDEETATFVQNGFAVINMGPNVLRVETAAAWAVGIVSVMLRETALWKLKE